MKKWPILLISLPLFLLVSISTPDQTHAQACALAGTLCEAGSDGLKLFSDPKACESFICLLDNVYNKPPATGSKWYSQTPQEFSNKVLNSPDNEVFGERYTYAQINWIINSLFTIINPIAGAQKPEDIIKLLIPLSNLLSSSFNPADQTDYLATLGPLGAVIKVMEYPYANPVASGINEVKTITKLIDPSTPALAQGVGFLKLDTANNVRELWKVSRNAAYLLTAILLVASAFMVMFRTQVSPQTIVSVQLIVPKLITSLVLITFSYAIVGFVIDMIYVAITSVLGLMFTLNNNLFSGPDGLTGTINLLTSGNFNFVARFLGVPIMIAILLFVILVLVQILASSVILSASLIPGILLTIATIGFGLFAWALYTGARIVGQLLLAYLNLIILTISGPLQIMMDVLPGKRDVGFKPWIMCVIGNASVFVSYIFLAIIAKALFGFDNVLFEPGAGGLGPGGGFFGFNLQNTRIDSNFTLPGVNFNLDFNTIWSFVWWLLLGMGYFTAVPDLVMKIKSSFCKEDDYSKWIEGLVKDTVGQFSKSGQEAGKSIGESIRERDRVDAQARRDTQVR